MDGKCLQEFKRRTDFPQKQNPLKIIKLMEIRLKQYKVQKLSTTGEGVIILFACSCFPVMSASGGHWGETFVRKTV